MSHDLVVLIYGHTLLYPYEGPPLSLFALGAALEAGGLRVAYYDERAQPWSELDGLLRQAPLAVGFSVMGGDQITAARRLTRRVREVSPDSRIVWGGFLPSRLPGAVLAEGGADAVAIGEAEETLLELCRSWAEGSDDLSRIAGTASSREGRVILGPRRSPPRLETLPFPYHDASLPLLRRFLERHAASGAVGYETTRGCAFSCGFCYSPRFHGSLRIKPLEQVRGELRRLRDLGVSRVDIYDDVLMAGSQERIFQLCDELRDLGLTWMANLRIEMATPALLSRLEDSGCRQLYFGLESDDDLTLRALSKGFSSSQVREGLTRLGASRIKTVLSVISGLPVADADASAARGLAFAQELRRLLPEAQIQVQSYLPLPDSALYAEALAKGWRPPASLSAWVEHDHCSVELPWLKDPSLPRKAYLSSFLAYRHLRYLSGLSAILVHPWHRLSLWRIERRWFRCYVEGWLYAVVMRASRRWMSFCFSLWRSTHPAS